MTNRRSAVPSVGSEPPCFRECPRTLVEKQPAPQVSESTRPGNSIGHCGADSSYCPKNRQTSETKFRFVVQPKVADWSMGQHPKRVRSRKRSSAICMDSNDPSCRTRTSKDDFPSRTKENQTERRWAAAHHQVPAGSLPAIQG